MKARKTAKIADMNIPPDRRDVILEVAKERLKAGASFRQTASELCINGSELIAMLNKALPPLESDPPPDERRLKAERAQEALNSGAGIWTIAWQLGVNPKTITRWLSWYGKQKWVEVLPICEALMKYLVVYLRLIRYMQRDLSLPSNYFSRPSSNDPQWNPSTEESEIVRWLTAKFAETSESFGLIMASWASEASRISKADVTLERDDWPKRGKRDFSIEDDPFDRFCSALGLQPSEKESLLDALRNLDFVGAELNQLRQTLTGPHPAAKNWSMRVVATFNWCLRTVPQLAPLELVERNAIVPEEAIDNSRRLRRTAH
jgi:hypothetical protein